MADVARDVLSKNKVVKLLDTCWKICKNRSKLAKKRVKNMSKTQQVNKSGTEMINCL